MTRSRTFLSLSVVGAVIAVTLGALPAAAATPTAVTITAGSAPTGTTAAFTSTSGSVTLHNLTTNIGFTCTSSKVANGTAKAGSGQGPNGTPAGTGIAQIPGTSATAAFTGCKTFFGPFSLVGGSATMSPWRFRADATSVPAAASTITASGQQTSGTLYNINLKWTYPTCTFNLVGSISGANYTNGSPSTLTVPAKPSAAQSNLTVSNFTLLNGASMCNGGFVTGNGNKFSLSTTYSVSANTAAQNPIWINAS